MVKHISHALVAELHPPLYLMHTYWARKPHNVVAEYIKHYSKEGEVVLDLFCGSGVAPIEAIKLNRRAIGIDINPMAIFISKMTAKPVDLKKYETAFNEIKDKVGDTIYELYSTVCPKCNNTKKIRYVVWTDNQAEMIRYECRKCSPGRGKYLEKEPDEDDKRKLREIERMHIPYWYPQNRLYYPDGTAFKEGTHIEGLDSIPSLFTKRALISLCTILNEIENLRVGEIKDILKFTFSACVHLASNMNPHTPTKWAAGWTEPRFWMPSRHREFNTWDIFEGRFKRVMEGKTESSVNKTVRDYRETDDFGDIRRESANIMWIRNDAIQALRKIPKNSVDYVFTDPTYGESIQYGELNFIWASWLGYGDEYLKEMKQDEVVINEQGQRKNFDQYYNMLYVIFREANRVLKPNKFMTVTFHNPVFRIRNALERACYVAGFDLDAIVYQPPSAIPSSKSSMQPYGSVTGDFYFRFRNVKKPGREIKEDVETFERVVVDATTRILAERGEPTPMPIISNGIEPALFEHGFPFSKEKTIEEVIIEHLDEDFVVYDKSGKEITKPKRINDKVLWLKDPQKYLLDRVPLKERVEKEVIGILRRKRKLEFTDVMVDLYTTFKNALTPDPPSVRAILDEYAETTKEKQWQLTALFKARESQHGTIIEYLAKIGLKCGFSVWVGEKKSKEVERMALKTLDLPIERSKLRRIRGIDVLWIKDEQIKFEFEVENTTAMLDAINRGSNITYPVKRFIVMPDERETFLKRRLQDPLLKSSVLRYGWKFIFYSALEQFYNANKRKKKLAASSIEEILAKIRIKMGKDGQLELFGKE